MFFTRLVEKRFSPTKTLSMDEALDGIIDSIPARTANNYEYGQFCVRDGLVEWRGERVASLALIPGTQTRFADPEYQTHLMFGFAARIVRGDVDVDLFRADVAESARQKKFWLAGV